MDSWPHRCFVCTPAERGAGGLTGKIQDRGRCIDLERGAMNLVQSLQAGTKVAIAGEVLP